jgi:hypothetical protein
VSAFQRNIYCVDQLHRLQKFVGPEALEDAGIQDHKEVIISEVMRLVRPSMKRRNFLPQNEIINFSAATLD